MGVFRIILSIAMTMMTVTFSMRVVMNVTFLIDMGVPSRIRVDV